MKKPEDEVKKAKREALKALRVEKPCPNPDALPLSDVYKFHLKERSNAAD